MKLLPFVDFYNLFNHSPSGFYGGLAGTFGKYNFDYTKSPDEDLSRLTSSRGRLNATRKVMIGVRSLS